MQTFFVTGLPRSRTAWLANLLTYGEAFCWHDLLGRCASLEELKERFHATACGYTAVGNADSGLGWFFPQVDRMFPEAQWVIVRREPAEAASSLYRHLARHPYPELAPPTLGSARDLCRRLDEVLNVMKDLLPTERTIELDYRQLESERVCREIWEFATGAGDWNHERWELLNELRVNPASEKISAARGQKLLSGDPSPLTPLPPGEGKEQI